MNHLRIINNLMINTHLKVIYRDVKNMNNQLEIHAQILLLCKHLKNNHLKKNLFTKMVQCLILNQQ